MCKIVIIPLMVFHQNVYLPVIIEGNRFLWVDGIHPCEEYCRSVFYIKASKFRRNQGRAKRWLDHPLSHDIFQILRCCVVVEH